MKADIPAWMTTLRVPSIAAILSMLIASPIVYAQPVEETPAEPEVSEVEPAEETPAEPEVSEAVDEFVVVGSHIPRATFEGPSPVEVLDREEFAIQQPQVMTDLTKRITANVGAEFQEDQFTANVTSGTASINLRGLGLSSTLVLFNGKRAVTNPGAPNSGAAFVDINNFPVDMIERVEIVKDGTAALYGSDAVAGVVNFITRKEFRGFEINGNFQSTTSDFFTSDAQQDLRLSALFGAGGDNTRMTGVVSWLDRTMLDAVQRDFTQVYEPTGALLGVSDLGSPPSFIPLGTNPQGYTPIDITGDGIPDIPYYDPACGTVPNSIISAIPGIPGAGLCQFQFAYAYPLVADETRIDGLATIEHDLTDTIEFYGEFAFNLHRNERTSSPSFPALQFPIIGPDNPGNPTNSTPGAADGAPVVFLGRAFGTINGANDGRERAENQLDTWRVVGGFKGGLGDLIGTLNLDRPEPEMGPLNDWEWDVSYLWSQSRLELRTSDVLTQNFLDALGGLGGTECDRVNGTPGDSSDGCYYFNPFGSAIGAQPGDLTYNDPDVIDDIVANIIARRQTTLQVVDGILSGTAAELTGGELGIALGGQYRHEEREIRMDDNSREDRFIFTVGTPEAKARRDVAAVFGEVAAPFWHGVETQLALRYERYSGAGETLDPKVGLLFRPFDALQTESPVDLTLRGNFSTAFRAPSLFQQYETQTTLEELYDGGSRVFRAVRNFGSKDLDNENSITWSAGTTVDLFDNDLSLSVDWWYFDYQDIVVKPSAQAILDAPGLPDPLTGCPTGVQGCVQIVRDPITNQLLRVETEFFNAASVETYGFDFLASYHLDPADHWDTGISLGVFDLEWRATYIQQYEIQESSGAPKQDVVGRRNFLNFASSLPELRFNARVIWSWGDHTLANSVQYISGYDDDECNGCTGGATTREIDSFTSWDITYSYFLDRIGEGTIFNIALLNVLDEDPPPVWTNTGYDTKIHDPRGRLFQVGFTQRF